MEYFFNCFLLLIPIVIWNTLLYKKLPDFYQPKIWDNIPKSIDVTENILRFLSFLLLFLFKINFETTIQRTGLLIYLAGLLMYFSSWYIQISIKTINMKKILLFRAAPAYTTIFWFIGIGMIGKYSFINVPYLKTIYYFIIIAFVGIHTYHSYIIYKNLSK